MDHEQRTTYPMLNVAQVDVIRIELERHRDRDKPLELFSEPGKQSGSRTAWGIDEDCTAHALGIHGEHHGCEIACAVDSDERRTLHRDLINRRKRALRDGIKIGRGNAAGMDVPDGELSFEQREAGLYGRLALSRIRENKKRGLVVV